MFHCNHLFSLPLLQALVKEGMCYFVRNSCGKGIEPDAPDAAAYFVITHYNDLVKANQHLQTTPNDPYCFLYDWTNSQHRNRLMKAANQPDGFRIYATLFYPDWKKQVAPALQQQVDHYVQQHTHWKPTQRDAIRTYLFWEFGRLYMRLFWKGSVIKVTFEELQSITLCAPTPP